MSIFLFWNRHQVPPVRETMWFYVRLTCNTFVFESSSKSKFTPPHDWNQTCIFWIHIWIYQILIYVNILYGTKTWITILLLAGPAYTAIRFHIQFVLSVAYVIIINCVLTYYEIEYDIFRLCLCFVACERVILLITKMTGGLLSKYMYSVYSMLCLIMTLRLPFVACLWWMMIHIHKQW